MVPTPQPSYTGHSMFRFGGGLVVAVIVATLGGEWTNSRAANLVSWVTVVIMIGLTLALVGITVRGMH